MAESPLQMTTRLRRKLEKRKIKAQLWGDYYDGRHPLKFASPEFRAQTGGLFDGFSDNWCSVVPNAMIERMSPMGFRLEDGTVDKAAGRAWKMSECDVEIGLSMLESLVSARCYALVWKPDGTTAEITFEPESQAIVEYVPGRRRVRAAGLKVWRDGDLEFATLFLPDMVYRYQRHVNGGEWADRTSGLLRSESAHFRNPIGLVPLVEIPNRTRLLAPPVSEIHNVIPLQNAVNALWAHVLTAADSVALPARAVLGMDRPVREILDPETGEVVGEEDEPIAKFRSDRLLWLEKPGASIAEFSAAPLSGFIELIRELVDHIAAQTRTPGHYLVGRLINVGVDGLAQNEAGLVAKVRERHRYTGAALREIMRIEALAAGEPRRAEALRLGDVIWRDPQFRSDAQYADALTKLKSINVPDEALWERIPGVTPEEIARWKSMRDDQAAAILGGNLAGMFGPKPEPAEEADAEPIPEAA
ncbi:phage portal protein [Kitasatospora purpeofusca]|uniref:phage portal protein n=1 Tax=Kitasatospora purpeofusca TaxID=67352 RepID=UPI002256640F|nr:phage portal protein [Kitasatospora purpeofusca]MCX4687235.1 phage portal protein [Kitasatospora purpeofusca]